MENTGKIHSFETLGAVDGPGIRFILLIPIGILNSIGLISNDGKSKIGNNIIIRMLSGIISLLTILSVIITIVVGWNDFLKIVKNILNI